jgi:hypothetical protein
MTDMRLVLTKTFRYSGMGFLSGLWVLGFNPLSLDLAFVQIPFLEQVIVFVGFSTTCYDSRSAWHLLWFRM